MNKSELKTILKPLIKECIKEVISEEGVLSGVITEVVKGTGTVITEAEDIQHQQADQQLLLEKQQ